jgi:hypothetical protein
MAMTFLSAPAISHPTTSGLVYTRKRCVMNNRWSSAAVAPSAHPITDAAG